MLKNFLIAGFGSFLGGGLRYLAAQYIHKAVNTGFPLGTLLINLIGCFIIGIIIGLFDKGSLVSPELRLFLTVGICGGFTTFSAFSADSLYLINDAEILNFLLYLGASVFLGITLTLLGKNLVNIFWSFL